MKHAKYIFLLALCLALTACGPKESDDPPAYSSGSQSGSSASQSESDPQDPPESPLPPDGSQTPEEPPVLPLTEEDKNAAYDAACDYYLGTVFEVHTLTEIDMPAGWEGEIAFRVSCSKEGVKVDPDRIISLERQNGTWIKVNEGY